MRVRGNMGNRGMLTACPVSHTCAVLPCALTPLCWIAPLLLGSSAMPSDHLGSSCILALPSVNNLQDDHLSAIKLCLCFLLARGVFGKQGYQCQGKVGCSCLVCVCGMCCFGSAFPCCWDILQLCSSGVTTALLPQAARPGLLSPCQVCWLQEQPLTFLQTPECLVAVATWAAPLRWP